MKIVNSIYQIWNSYAKTHKLTFPYNIDEKLIYFSSEININYEN